MIRPLIAVVAVILWTPTMTIARDLHVGTGPDAFTSINAAIAAAEPGDTIHLDPEASPYRELPTFHNKSGTPDKPITLDGHGATLLGSDPLAPDQWEDRGDGLWRSTALAEQLNVNSSVIGRFFFIFEGRPQYMGGAFKHATPTLKPADELATNEWTYLEDENAFYIRIEPDQPLEAAAVEAPVRSAGINVRGASTHLVIRNVKARHAWNDGFNIHGQCKDIRFENIEASACGDDGISAHGQCEIVVEGFRSHGNANGICHVNESRSVNRDVHISASRAHDLYLLNESEHEFHDIVIEANAPRGTVLTRGTTVSMQRVRITSEAGPTNVHVTNDATLTADRSAFWNAHMAVQDASVQLNHCAAGGPHASLRLSEPRAWVSQHNVWDVQQFVYDGQSVAGDDLAGFSKLTQQDDNSHARPLTLEEVINMVKAGKGADR